MKRNAFEALPISETKSLGSKILLTNCGFSPNFFNELEQNYLEIQNNNNKIKKIKSENELFLLKGKNKIPKRKIYEAEDKDDFNIKYNDIKKEISSNYNNSMNNISSYTTIPSQDCLNKNNSEIISINNNYMIKAYKSKLKKKYGHLYKINSKELEEKNKFKLYHKCCYPDCNRTFSSSGWLKAHLKNHLKQIHNSKYCILFENFIMNENIHKITNKNKSIFIQNKSINNINSINDNVSLNNNINKPFLSEINFPKPSKLFFNNENDSNIYSDSNFLNLNNFMNKNFP